MATPTSSNLVSDVFGSYRVLHRIGEGGMGEVYLAEHKHMDRKAAIKVLRPEFSAKVDLVGRFFAEARAANLIKHPGIVEIYDCSVLPNGCAYIVMEYLEGQTLGAALERLGHIDEVLTMVDLSWQIATALQAAHDKDIIHRDLKPDNIFLTFVPDLGPSPKVKILDFGIAKLMHSAIKNTQTGSLLGTPLYMSPEQARGLATVDHRTDIYSLGCIMFEMNTGRPPFVREGMGDLILAHASEIPPPPSKIQPKIPPEIDQLITGMLAKHPEDRPRSMQEIATVLHMFLVRKGNMASTSLHIPELDEGLTSQFHRSSPVVPVAPLPEAKPRPRKVAPTEILPPSEQQPRPLRPFIQAAMTTEHSWIARAQRTSNEPRPKRPVNVQSSPAPKAAEPASTPEPKKRGILFAVGIGALVGTGVFGVGLLVGSPSQTVSKQGMSAPAEPTSSPSVSPAAAQPPPAFEPPPLAVPRQPPAPPQPQPVPPAPVNSTPATEKPKHQARHSAPQTTGLGAETLAGARQAFKAGDYIAAGIQAKRAARQGAGLPAYLLLGDSMLQLESYAEAKEAYQSALELDPGNAIAKRKLRTISQKTSR